ncbi:MAG: bifunctional diaminohydroxyphosphoribosylaminopyrimidine deaminase/5-amino-6-(5-phosphoribosylamino)uracil reductase RibD [Gemmatimonadales bacterium]|nr:MAG: bifunctional diaminohydroxyphosphoribosylaminopyrimidine deaminase/5-amino-6-(5-phosphoribosylamino)uracil reductase RibD [Gemmatimonadales bacterium]
MPSDLDLAFLRRAVELGRRGWGQVHPNPMVGCVVARQDRVLGEGWHQAWGGPHAEVNALAAVRDAGEDPAGATAYVSLEPCSHEGKTPPCTRALRDAGVARVVYGAADPGAESGGGGAELRAAGLEVEGPVMTDAEARRENPAFFHAFGPHAGRPWVVLKLAVSADGFLAAGPGQRTAISGAQANARVQELRAGMDAILVGGRTAEVDDPLLTVRGAVTPRVPPRRVVLDPLGTLPPEARLFHTGPGEVVVFRGEGGGEGGNALPAGARIERLSPVTMRPAEGGPAEGGSAEGVPGEGPPGQSTPGKWAPGEPVALFHLPDVLTRLRVLGVRALLCEGGAELARSLLREDLVDRMILVRAERSLGPGGVPAFPGGWTADMEGWDPVEPPETLGSDTWSAWDRAREAG